jgi:hypothetical protein
MESGTPRYEENRERSLRVSVYPRDGWRGGARERIYKGGEAITQSLQVLLRGASRFGGDLPRGEG